PILIESTVLKGAQIRYLSVSICQTDPKAKGFSGYIHLPPGALEAVGVDQELPMKIFFWFVESQNSPATSPLTLYTQMKPNTVTALLRENGPCRVNLDSSTLEPNPCAWNKISNIIYIDQPVNTGWSDLNCEMMRLISIQDLAMMSPRMVPSTSVSSPARRYYYGRSFFDIAHRSHFLTDPPLNTYLRYLKQAKVQQALGTPVNFTDQAINVAHTFSLTGDNVRGEYVANLAQALDSGVRVSLIYGYRDYACNCACLSTRRYVSFFVLTNRLPGLGGEALSLSISYKGQATFQRAGYTSTYGIQKDEKGAIPPAYLRQHGGLSFVRVLNSSHTVNTVWPSLGFVLFNRTLHDVDLATGYEDLIQSALYSTSGPSSVRHIRNKLPTGSDLEEGMCYVLELSLCSNSQLNAYLKGKGGVIDYWLVDYGNGTCCPNPIQPCREGHSGFGGIKVYLGFGRPTGDLSWFHVLMLVGAVMIAGIIGLLLQNLAQLRNWGEPVKIRNSYCGSE
ncbi:hypothetical protein N7537_008984, partial [Penicillium hordei]